MNVATIIAELTPLEHDILTIYAIAFTPLASEQAAELISLVNIKTPDGHKLRRQLLNQTRKSLIEKGILAQPNSFGYYNHSIFISNVELCETLTYEAAQHRNFKHWARIVQDYYSRHSLYYYGDSPLTSGLRNTRIALYLGDFNQLDILQTEALRLSSHSDTTVFTRLYAKIFGMPFRPQWFETFPPELQRRVLPYLTESMILNGLDTRPLENYLLEKHPNLEEIFLLQLFRGSLKPLQTLKTESPETVPQHLLGALCTLQGDYAEAVLHFEAYAKQWRRNTSKKKGVPPILSYLFYPMALLSEKSQASIKKALEICKYQAKNTPDLESAFRYISAGGHYLLNAKQEVNQIIRSVPAQSLLDSIVWCIVKSWMNTENLYDSTIAELLEQAQKDNFWFVLEVAHYLSLTKYKKQRNTGFLQKTWRLKRELNRWANSFLASKNGNACSTHYP